MTKDLTKGKIMPLLVGFTIPLVLGNLFQLTYNAVDSIIVGQFVGKEALAAVGICNPVMTLMILFLNGLCMGASILMGTQFGAKDYNKLQRQISTTMLSGTVFSAILSLCCIIFSRLGHMLREPCDYAVVTLFGRHKCCFLRRKRIFFTRKIAPSGQKTSRGVRRRSAHQRARYSPTPAPFHESSQSPTT